ncbi:FeoB-associated Cys-rich membrane protein [Ichthyenterobacterium magnum]|uniref:Attachment p12 family protein n=1 Tax=Ichthyenterobacterium magnum TaxID=1230530 RepID=A0A420DXM9_9FLAO|nr:FeoB-associated Cys-rich membrane protein [Ichthyenterobacterium magnum]RKE98957.1 hypothetical protein BXY80_1054 [Ichthyenterobacterium magnum]
MNTTIQTILVIITVSLALVYLAKKFVLKPKKESNKSCGSSGCGCD